MGIDGMDKRAYCAGESVSTNVKIQCKHEIALWARCTKCETSDYSWVEELRKDVERLRSENESLRKWLLDEATLLDAWAKESQKGGWSTHQVGPMKERANDLRRIANP